MNKTRIQVRILFMVALLATAYWLILLWNNYFYNQNQMSQPTLNLQAIAQERSLIYVETDEQDILIDPKGGDFVYLGLKAYAKKRHSSEHFILLNQIKPDEPSYITQTGFIGLDGINSQQAQPLYQSNKMHYVMQNEKLRVSLTHESKGVIYTKHYDFTSGSYAIKQTLVVDNQRDTNWQGHFFRQSKRDLRPDPSLSRAFGGSFLGNAYSSSQDKYEKLKLKYFAKKSLREESLGGWSAILQHYFLTVWIGNSDEEWLIYGKSGQFQDTFGDSSPAIVAGLRSIEYRVPPKTQKEESMIFYAGPKIKTQLERLHPTLDLAIDYGWLWFISRILMTGMNWLNSLIPNWGLSIILMTVIIKLLFLPLTQKSYRSMAKMRDLTPKMQQIKEIYGDNKETLSREMMALYKKEKVNPMGGCLPLLIQMPIFIGLYWALKEGIEFRHASFLWVDDLSNFDPNFILPILMGLTMFGQQSMSPSPNDPTQAKLLKLMPIFFTLLFLWFPAGLTLYWSVSNSMTILQQLWIKRQLAKEHHR